MSTVRIRLKSLVVDTVKQGVDQPSGIQLDESVLLRQHASQTQ
jgi:hypothetical protein